VILAGTLPMLLVMWLGRPVTLADTSHACKFQYSSKSGSCPNPWGTQAIEYFCCGCEKGPIGCGNHKYLVYSPTCYVYGIASEGVECRECADTYDHGSAGCSTTQPS
jgi:hypothetical protein